MPIRITCSSCGHSMAVPDAYAGKSGKCPKCSQSVRIPGAAAAAEKLVKPTAAPTGATPSKPRSAASQGPATSSKPTPVAKKSMESKSKADGLDLLFAEAGLDKKSGQTCPSCQSPVRAGTVLCTACGYHFESKQKVQGFELAVEAKGPYAHKALNEADRNLDRESAEEHASKFVGWPWWVYLAFVFGLIMLIVFGVLLREGAGPKNEFGESAPVPEGSLAAIVQSMHVVEALLFISMLIASMVACMASIATLFTAFREKIVCGILCLFIPFYVYYYAFTRRATMAKTTWILFGWTIASIVLAVAHFGYVVYKVATANPDG